MSIKTKYILSSGEYFHVYNRGVAKGKIFFSDRNYRYFIRRINEAFEEDYLEIIAYCLMPNHFHFIFFQKRPLGISDFIKAVCNGYVKAINKERQRSGHLFEGKYKIKKIDSNEYILHLSRYIHLNPVRAKLVSKPDEWLFSSYKEYIGSMKSGNISPDIILKQFRNTSQYQQFVEDYVLEDRKKITPLLL